MAPAQHFRGAAFGHWTQGSAVAPASVTQVRSELHGPQRRIGRRVRSCVRKPLICRAISSSRASTSALPRRSAAVRPAESGNRAYSASSRSFASDRLISSRSSGACHQNHHRANTCEHASADTGPGKCWRRSVQRYESHVRVPQPQCIVFEARRRQRRVRCRLQLGAAAGHCSGAPQLRGCQHLALLRLACRHSRSPTRVRRPRHLTACCPKAQSRRQGPPPHRPPLWLVRMPARSSLPTGG